MIEIKVNIKNDGEAKLKAEGTLTDIFSESVVAVVNISKILEDKISLFGMEDLFETARKHRTEILEGVYRNETKTVQPEKPKGKDRAIENKLDKLIEVLKDAVCAADEEE